MIHKATLCNKMWFDKQKFCNDNMAGGFDGIGANCCFTDPTWDAEHFSCWLSRSLIGAKIEQSYPVDNFVSTY